MASSNLVHTTERKLIPLLMAAVALMFVIYVGEMPSHLHGLTNQALLYRDEGSEEDSEDDT